MIITEFRLDHPAFRSALQAVPEMTITWQRSDSTDEARELVLFWATGGDFDEFEAALAEDPTAGSPRQVYEVGERRLYRMELKGEGLEQSVYPILVEEGGVIHSLRADHRGWEFQAGFPSRASFDRVTAFCRTHDIGFEFHAIYEEDETDGQPGYGLTASQRETLLEALECGFFEIPRECSLADLGDRLGVSETATSERVRRAMRSLVTNTISQRRTDP